MFWQMCNTIHHISSCPKIKHNFFYRNLISSPLKNNKENCNILKTDKLQYKGINENTPAGKKYIAAIKEEAVTTLGYFLKPAELFSEIAKRGNTEDETDEKETATEESKTHFILEDLQKILNNIQQSTMGTDSEEDFDHLFEDMDLNSTKLGKTPQARNGVIAKVLAHLDKIDFQLQHTELDVLGDAYEYLIAQFASGAGKKAGEAFAGPTRLRIQAPRHEQPGRGAH